MWFTIHSKNSSIIRNRVWWKRTKKKKKTRNNVIFFLICFPFCGCASICLWLCEIQHLFLNSNHLDFGQTKFFFLPFLKKKNEYNPNTMFDLCMSSLSSVKIAVTKGKLYITLYIIHIHTHTHLAGCVYVIPQLVNYISNSFLFSQTSNDLLVGFGMNICCLTESFGGTETLQMWIGPFYPQLETLTNMVE